MLVNIGWPPDLNDEFSGICSTAIGLSCYVSLKYLLAGAISKAKERGQLQGFVPFSVVKWLLKWKLGKETANKVINM